MGLHEQTIRGDVMPSTHHGILIHVVFSTKQRFTLLHESWRDDLYCRKHAIEFDERFVFDDEIVA